VPKFKNDNEVYDAIGGLCRRLLDDSEIGPQLAGLDMSVRFTFSEPIAEITLVCHGSESKVTCGACDDATDLELLMKADDGHRLWLGTLSPMMGMAKRKIRTKGDVMKALGLQSVLDSATEIYRALLVELGRSELLEV
jgi:putative sterol carrier protein